MKAVTLHDIAKRAEVSVATVSLALRGRGEVSKQQAQKIQDLAREMGYRPNPMLAALASKRFSTAKTLIGTPLALLEFPQIPGQPPPKVSLYRNTLVEEARHLGYEPTVYTIEADTSATSLYRQLYNRTTQGIIITGSVDMDHFGKQFDWAPFAIVQCARYWATNPFNTVRSNIIQAIKLTFTKLRERGYERIGFAVGRHDILLEDDEDRHGAAIALATAYLAKKNQLPAYLGAFDDSKPFMAWYRKYKPDVVVGFNGMLYQFLLAEGVRIPEETGFVVLHDGGKRGLAGLDQNNTEIARQSIHQLDLLIRNHERGMNPNPTHILLPSIWHDGPSIRGESA